MARCINSTDPRLLEELQSLLAQDYILSAALILLSQRTDCFFKLTYKFESEHVCFLHQRGRSEDLGFPLWQH